VGDSGSVRRLLTFVLLIVALSTLLVGLPTVTPAGATPQPVPPSVERIPLAGVESGALSALGQGEAVPTLLSAPLSTRPFSVMGVTWSPDPAVGEVEVQMRHRAGGSWSEWTGVEAEGEDVPDADAAERREPGYRTGSAPIWTGPSDGVQVRLDVLSGAAPRDVRVELVDPGTSPADALLEGPRGRAAAEAAQPAIITREEWGADESIRRGSPSYNTTVKVGFVHHTASSNDYTAEQAAAMVRGIYAYHVTSNGWSDIGYNYLVDRFGRAYEGRFGGLDAFVIGAHTGGFNKGSLGVSLLGDFSTVPPSDSTLRTLSDVLAWKLGTAHRDPLGEAVLTSAGGGTSKYSAGTDVSFDVISGHRDAGSTACPGATTYSRMDEIREQTAQRLGAGFADPTLTGGMVHSTGSSGPVTLTARTLGDLDWAMTVQNGDGSVLQQTTGVTTGSETVSASWDLTDGEGEPVEPGDYLLRLSGSRAGDQALPFTQRVTVRDGCRGSPLDRALCRSSRRSSLIRSS
jgi:hypothetical protein